MGWLRRLFGWKPPPAPPRAPEPEPEGNLARKAEPDRRRWPRVQLELQVRLRFSSAEAMIRCSTFDVSRGGVFIVLPNPRPEGTKVRLTLAIGDRELIIGGVVVRQVLSGAEPHGMGIFFTELSADDEGFIAALTERAP